MAKEKDPQVEIPADSKLQLSDDWNPTSIQTQEEAVRWARKFPEINVAYVTSDKNLFTLENIEFGINHVIMTGVKGFKL